MSLYTQNFNLNAALAAPGGAATLTLTFSNINGAPGAPVSGPPAVPPTGIPTPIVDAHGVAIEIKPYIDFDRYSEIYNAPEDQSFLNYAIATNAATLANMGTATSFVVGTVTYAVGTAASTTTVVNFPDTVSAFNAAMNALLTATVDTAGGRAAIQFVNIDTITKDMTTAASGSPLFSPTVATVVTDESLLNSHLSQGPEGQGPEASGDSIEGQSYTANLNLTTAQLNGYLRLKIALGTDPSIGDVKFQEIDPTSSNGLQAKLYGGAEFLSGNYDLDNDTISFDASDPDSVVDGTPFIFNTTDGAGIPGGLTAGTTYYAVNVNEVGRTFQLSATPGGGVIDLMGKQISVASATTGLITATNHGFMDGDQIKLNGTVAVGGVLPGVTYYVIASDTNSFKLSLTDGGTTAVALTASTSLPLVNLSNSADVFVHALTPNVTDVSSLSYSATVKDGVTTFTGGDNLMEGQPIIFGSGVGAVVPGTEYFVKTINADGSFTVSATLTTDGLPGAAVTNTAALLAGKVLASVGDDTSAYYGVSGYQTLESVESTLITGFTVDFPSKIAVANGVSSSPQFNAFPVDIATLNAIGALGDGLTLTFNLTPQEPSAGFKPVSQFVSVSLAQADAIASNGITINLVGLNPKEFAFDVQAIGEDSYTPTSLFKIRDTAANLQLMTVEQANNLNAFIQSIRNVDDFNPMILGSPSNDFGPQFIDIAPITKNTTTGADIPDTTPITLSFDVAQALANNGIRISLGAQVSTNVGGGFGTITGEDLLHLVDAGVDRIGFDNSTVTPAAPALPYDPFAGQNVRSVILSSQDLAPISKMNITGLKGNTTIDVAVVVDDSNGSVMVPGSLLAKMGVDRIVADDGMLDIRLNDARNLLKVTKDNATPPMLGNVGDKSDVNLIIEMDRDFSNTKAPVIAQYAKSGIDIISYEGNLNFLNSLSQSKNLIDTVSAGVKNGIGFNLSSEYSDISDIHLNIGVLSSAGIGANLLATVNNLDDHIYINSRNSNYSQGADIVFDQIELLASGVRSDWVSINNMSLVWSDGYSDSWGDDPWNNVNYETVLNTFASMTKVVAKANSAPGAAVLVDMQDYSNSDYGSSAGNILKEIWASDRAIFAREMAEFGKTVFGIKNLYADFRVSDDDWNQVTENSDFQSDLISNFSKMGFKGIVVDENSVNDYADYGAGRGADGDNFSSDVLPLSKFSQSLDIVYHLDAASSSSSVGLSSYLYEDGSVTDAVKDNYFNSDFKANVGAIDRIIITNGQDGDLSLDLSAFGVYGAGWSSSTATQVIDPVNGGFINYNTIKVNDSNFAAMITHTVNGGKATTANDMFEIRTSAGKYVAVQIVGLTDWTQFNAADLKDASHIVPDVFIA